MTNWISLRTLIGVSLALTAVACTSRSRSVEVPIPKPNNSGNAQPPGGYDDQGRDASATLSIPQEIAQKYLDPNGNADYQFTYLDIDQSGAVQFQNGAAIIELSSLPSGLEGEMTLKIFEGGKEKLSGSQAGVKLNSGKNKLTLSLKPVDDGSGNGNGNNGDKNADLELQIVVDDGTGNTGGGNTGGGNTGGGNTGGAPNFAAVKSIAVKSCYGVCHFHRDGGEEVFFTSRDKNRLIDRLNGNGVPIMPLVSADPAEQLNDADRQKLIDYVNSL